MRFLMFTDKSYTCVCSGCGTIHTVVAAFLSTSTANIGGKYVGVHGCPDCVKKIETDDNPIRRAWLHGMTAEARQRAERELEARDGK